MQNAASELFGVFELNVAGTVLYSKINPQYSNFVLPTDLIGQNFFDEINNHLNVSELRRRFIDFAKGRDAVENFTFVYPSEPEPIKARVMLTKIYQRESGEAEKLIILDIRKVQ